MEPAMSELPLPLPIDNDKIELSFAAIKIRQPIGDIYVCTVDHATLQKITYFDVRRVMRDERDLEKYLGIQRPVNEARIDRLKEYVNYRDATFPSSIILSIDEEHAYFDEKTRKIIVSNTRRGEKKPDIAIRNLCRVIDGQHRIAGLEGFKGENFEVPVSLFVGSDISDQAYIFATVNLEQTKVNKSLAYDLYELAKTRSPEKTCHNIAVVLDQDNNSPFYKRIKRLGTTTVGRNANEDTIAQATFVQSIIPYISSDPKGDRDALLRGRVLSLPTRDEEKQLIFRRLFIGLDDKTIGKILEQYFLAVSARWPDAWNNGGQGNVLNKTNGFRALMKVFRKAYLYFATPGQLVSASKYGELFKAVKVDDSYFTVANFRPGSSGEADLRKFLEKSMGLDDLGS
jgi:DGQHR domain-containing protein